MKVFIDKIKEITLGAVNIEYIDGYYKFHRFTEEQEKYYESTDAICYVRVPATAGIKMHFATDGDKLSIKVKAKLASSRSFFSLDFFINGVYIDSLDNFTCADIIDEYPKQSFCLGEFEKTFILGEGEKEISIYFPWSVELDVKEIEIVNATFINALKPEKKILFYGDSITQGYDAMRSFNRYANSLAEALNAEEINKGIGGEGFAPYLAALRESFMPEYICVAYGTNDWCNSYFEDFSNRLEKFFFILNQNYPESKIFAISPIWRKDYKKNTRGWDFSTVKKTTDRIAKEYNNVFVINGFGLVPHNEKYFSDNFNVHPNDLGFNKYSRNLIGKIKKI